MAFDRIQGVRLGARAARQIMDDIAAGRDHVTVIGLEQRGIRVIPYVEAMAAMDLENDRPKEQSFLRWRGLADKLAKPGPSVAACLETPDARCFTGDSLQHVLNRRPVQHDIWEFLAMAHAAAGHG